MIKLVHLDLEATLVTILYLRPPTQLPEVNTILPVALDVVLMALANPTLHVCLAVSTTMLRLLRLYARVYQDKQLRRVQA